MEVNNWWIWGTRVLDLGYEGIRSGVRGYQYPGVRGYQYPGYEGINIRGYEGINIRGTRVSISGVRGYQYPGVRGYQYPGYESVRGITFIPDKIKRVVYTHTHTYI